MNQQLLKILSEKEIIPGKKMDESIIRQFFTLFEKYKQNRDLAIPWEQVKPPGNFSGKSSD